jgi:hypothetical protein
VNWRSLLVVFGATLAALVAYDIVVGPAIAMIAAPPKADK